MLKAIVEVRLVASKSLKKGVRHMEYFVFFCKELLSSKWHIDTWKDLIVCEDEGGRKQKHREYVKDNYCLKYLGERRVWIRMRW